jgi:hypothetical protein
MLAQVLLEEAVCPVCSSRVLGIVDDFNRCTCEHCHRQFELYRTGDPARFLAVFQGWSMQEAIETARKWNAEHNDLKFRPRSTHLKSAAEKLWAIEVRITELCGWVCFNERDFQKGLHEWNEAVVRWAVPADKASNNTDAIIDLLRSEIKEASGAV